MHRWLLLAALLGCVSVVFAADRPEGRSFATRSVVWYAKHGMVAAAHPLAVQIGLDVLKDGGSAVDAAIAVNAALALMEPTSCGLGGDLFAMVWDPGRTPSTASTAPAGRLRPSPRQGPGRARRHDPLYSPYAWTVPGCVDGWFELHSRFGRLPMARLLAPDHRRRPRGRAGAAGHRRRRGPAARRASRTSRASPRSSCPAAGRRPRARSSPTRPWPTPSSGSPTAVATPSTRRDRPRPGRLLEKVGGFFSPRTSPATQRVGRADLDHLPRAHGVGAAAQRPGPRRAADAQHPRGLRPGGHGPRQRRLLAPAGRGQEARLRGPRPLLRRPAFAEVPVAERCRQGLRRRARRVQAHRHEARRQAVEPGNPAPRHGDTTFLVAADASGMMVSLIQSNYTGFGSGYVVPELGFGIQDRGALFSLDPAPPQRAGARQAALPHHHPRLHGRRTACPTPPSGHGRRHAAPGARPDRRQPGGLRHEPPGGGRRARFHHTGSSEPTGTVMTDGGVLHLGKGLPPEVAARPRKRGHRIEEVNPAVFGGYQIIRRDAASASTPAPPSRARTGWQQVIDFGFRISNFEFSTRPPSNPRGTGGTF
jgi:gamma-glutamyltranspeptidase / glutathione hydrolase